MDSKSNSLYEPVIRSFCDGYPCQMDSSKKSNPSNGSGDRVSDLCKRSGYLADCRRLSCGNFVFCYQPVYRREYWLCRLLADFNIRDISWLLGDIRGINEFLVFAGNCVHCCSGIPENVKKRFASVYSVSGSRISVKQVGVFVEKDRGA